MKDQHDNNLSEAETAKRRDEALKRALSMPHKPHKSGADKKPTPKPVTSKNK